MKLSITLEKDIGPKTKRKKRVISGKLILIRLAKLKGVFNGNRNYPNQSYYKF
jgi:hypothetical protein